MHLQTTEPPGTLEHVDPEGHCLFVHPSKNSNSLAQSKVMNDTLHKLSSTISYNRLGNCGVWGREPPRLEIVSKSDTFSVDLDQLLAKLS